MSRLKKKFGRRILAYVLSGAMIMSNMTAFASEPSHNTGGGYVYEEIADADDAESAVEAEAKEVFESEDNNSDGKDDGNESSDETAETTVKETEVKGSEQATEETEKSDEEQASETKSSLSAEKEETGDKAVKETEKTDKDEDVKGDTLLEMESGQTYSFSAVEITEADGTVLTSRLLGEDYFELVAGSNTKLQTGRKDAFYEFDSSTGNVTQETTLTQRIALGGAAVSTTQKVIKFITKNSVDVTVYWCSNNGNRMSILNASGTKVAETIETAVGSGLYKSVMTLEDGGTYYLGGNNYVYKVVVGPKTNETYTDSEKYVWDFANGKMTVGNNDTKKADLPDMSRDVQKCTLDYFGLKVDANNSGKFRKQEGKHVNFIANTTIRVPLIGKSKVTVVASAGAQYALYTVDGEPAPTTIDTKDFICSGENGYATIIATGTAYIKSITVTPIQQVTVSGSVSATPAIDGEYSVVFTELDNNGEEIENSSVEAKVENGSYEIKVDPNKTYKVSLSDGDYNVTTPASKTIEVGTSNISDADIVASKLTLEQVNVTIATPENVAVPDGLKITFTAQGEEDHKAELTYEAEKADYTVGLKPGVPYTVTSTAKNINDYNCDTTEASTANPNITITFTEKQKHEITVAISTFDKAEIERPTITFTNVNEEDYSYTRTKDEKIELRNGTYSISMDVNYPYVFDSSQTFEVTDSSDKTLTLELKERMKWDFTDTTDKALTKVEYQASTNEYDEYNGLRVITKRLESDNSKYGKFSVQPDQSRVQVIANTTIQIPVSGTGSVQIITSQTSDAGHYYMNGTLATTYNNPWNYNDAPEGTYMTLEATAQFYLKQIIVTRDEVVEEKDYRLVWDFTSDPDNEWANINMQGAQTGLGPIAGSLLVDARNGKFVYRKDNGDVQINPNTLLLVPVKGDSKITITISSDPSTEEGKETGYKVGESGTAATSKEQTFVVKGEDLHPAESAPYQIRIVTTGTGSIYLRKIVVEPIVEVVEKPTSSVAGKNANGKPDVWDFAGGATALDDAGKPTEYIDTTKYNNMLTEDIMNSWYGEDVAAGTLGKDLSSFVIKNENDEILLEFNGNGKTNNRIRTKNKNITRKDEKSLTIGKDEDKVEYLGYVYSNSSSTADVYLGVMLEAGDIVTAVVSSNGNDSSINFAPVDGTEAPQIYQYSSADGAGIATFYATKAGEYKIYSTNEKLVVARLTVEKTDYVKVSGQVTAPESLKSYSVAFKCKETGKTKTAKVTNGEYAIYLNEGYTYDVALGNANGYVVKNETPNFTLAGDIITIVDDEKAYNYDVTVEAVELVTVTGSVQGLTPVAGGNQEPLKSVKLTFEGDKIYVPELTLSRTAGTFTLKLEKDVEYKVTAADVDDFNLVTDKILASADGTQNITFAAKPVWNVTISPDGVTADELATTNFVFSRINVVDDVKEYDKDYVYTFKGTEGIQLRDGQYEVKAASCPFTQELTSDLKVEGADVTKTIKFNKNPITLWNFADPEFTDPTNYKGLLMSGVSKNKTYALGGANGEYKIPVAGPCTVTAYYCYNATGTIEDTVEISLVKDVDEAYGSTTKEKASVYDYTGEGGYVTIKTTATTYMTKITLVYAAGKVDYKEKITVGATGCDYTSINDALDAVREMDRTDDQRVTIEIQPGDYEEMLVIDTPNVTLKNANAEASIKPINKGVDIDASSVRITSYYGHGYAYYSMGKDCKWNADILAVNKANGSLSFTNPGTGTTSGSYWNATVVVGASGFEADGIIFENSFNQYISKKAADDVIIPLSGAKGENLGARNSLPAGDTSVQKKEYVERAAALAIKDGNKNISFNNCSFISRQDTLFGGVNATAAFYACDIYGGTDYIFGGMIAVFAKCDLVFNTNDQTDQGNKTDVGYITAAQQGSGRGYLMYNCRVTSTTPGVNTASEKLSKPGYFGRPWAANTAEALFYKTIIEKTDYSGQDESLILPVGWNDGLSGKSGLSQEYASIELAGVDNSAKRADWSKVLTADADGNVTLADGNTTVTDDTVVKAFLGDWDAFAGKNMTIATSAIEKPVADKAPGTVLQGTTITLACATKGAVIYYTMDGTDPTDQSTKYTEPISLGDELKTITIKAIAIKGEDKSEIVTLEYTVSDVDPATFVYAPVSSIATGETVDKGTKITLTSATEDAEIYYTTDGSEPTAQSTKYAGEITIDETVTIKAIAIKGENKSEISTFTYTVKADTPVTPPPVGPVIKTIRLEDCTITVPSIMADKKTNPNNETMVSVSYTDKENPNKVITIRFAEGLDYTVEWNGLKEGTENTYTVTIKGNGRKVDEYKIDENSSITKEYLVYAENDNNVINLSKAKITLDGTAKSAFYTGHGVEPEVTEVKVGKVSVDLTKCDVSYKSNVNAGTATVIVSADSNAEYKEGESFVVGSATATFNINKAALNINKNQLNVVARDQNNEEFGSRNYPYRGIDAVELSDAYSYVETVEGVVLEEGVDYEVSYKNNHKAGKATVTIKGIGNNITGTWTKQFTIEPLDFNNFDEKVLRDDSLLYSPKGAKLGYVVVRNATDEITLKEGVDFKVSYKYADKKAKKAESSVTYTVKGMNACKGTFTDTGTIKKADFADAIEVTGDIIVDATKGVPSGTKLNKAIEKAAVVTDLYGAKLKVNKEYQISVDSENKKVTITPANAVVANYTDNFNSLERDYYTLQNIAKLKKVEFAKNFVKYYDGRNPVELDEDDIKQLGSYQFELGTDVEIVGGSYKNNCKAGTASVTIRGISANGQYYGTKTIKFKIKEA